MVFPWDFCDASSHCRSVKGDLRNMSALFTACRGSLEGFKTGAANDCFLLNICSEERNIAYNFLFHSRTIFWSLISHFTSQVRLFFVEKWKPKIFRFKNVMERRIRPKCLTFVIPQISPKIFGKIILKPLQFREDSSSARITEQMQILQHRLECISKDLKELWIA